MNWIVKWRIKSMAYMALLSCQIIPLCCAFYFLILTISNPSCQVIVSLYPRKSCGKFENVNVKMIPCDFYSKGFFVLSELERKGCLCPGVEFVPCRKTGKTERPADCHRTAQGAWSAMWIFVPLQPSAEFRQALGVLQEHLRSGVEGRYPNIHWGINKLSRE